MATKRTGFFVRQEVYEKVRDHCKQHGIVMARWVEDTCLAALQPTRVPVPTRPAPRQLDDAPEEDKGIPAWSQPPFWHRS